MGSGTSTHFLESCPGVVNSQYSMMTFPARFKMDEVAFFFVDQDTIFMTADAFNRHWSKGIKLQFAVHQRGGMFKLNGYPFGYNNCNSSRHAISMAHVMSTIVEGMMVRGWLPRAGINFYRHTRSDSFLFARDARPDLQPKVSALDLNSSDQIHLINFPESICNGVAQAVIDHWPSGLKRQKTYSNMTDHKIITKGFPFRAHYIEDKLANSRMMLLSMIRLIYKHGYAVILSAHPQQSVEEVDTIFFAPCASPPPQLFLFGPQKHDWMITVSAPAGVDDIIRQAINVAWPDGQHEDKEETHGEMHCFKMHGWPWQTRGSTATNARKIMLTCFRALREKGWRVESTIDTNKNLSDISCFLMASCPPETKRFFALKLGGSRAVKLIDAPENVVAAVITCLDQVRPFGYKIQGEDPSRFNMSAGFDFSHPWFCFIVGAIEALGWRLISSADLSVKFHADRYSRFPIDLHTLFFEEL